MLSIFLLSFIQSQKQICICNNKCSLQCPQERYILVSSNSNFENFISKFNQEKEIWLYFYSSDINFEFEIDLKYFHNTKITLKAINESKSIKIKIKEEGNSFDRIINIDPDFQINLPNLIPIKSTTTSNNKIILDDTGQTDIPISVGLAQMAHTGSLACNNGMEPTLDNLIYTECDYTNLESQSAYQCGFRCWTTSATSFEYTFTGVKFAIFGTFDSLHGIIDLQIDEGEIIKIDESGERQEFSVIYTSDILDYGQHKIKLSSEQTYELYKIVYWPDLRARRLNSTQLLKTGSWMSESDGIGGVREFTSDEGGSATIEIEASQIWVYGSKAPLHSDMKITFEGETTTVSQASDTRFDGELLYTSPLIDFGKHQLKIESSGTILLYCIYFLYDPPPQTKAPYPSITPDATPEPTNTPIPTPVPISVGLTQMIVTGGIACEPSDFSIEQSKNLGCDLDDLEAESAVLCGFRCWTSSANFEYNFTGVKFQIYGTNDPNHGSFDVVVDDQPPFEVNEFSEIRKMHALLYTSNELEYKEHHVLIRNRGETYELFKLSYWPWVTAKRVNISAFEKTNEWKRESDGVGGVREYTDYLGGSATTRLKCSKFWIFGTKASWFHNMEVKVNDQSTVISVRSESRDDGVFLYESEILPFEEHILTLIASGGPAAASTIMINCVYFIDEPAMPTPTMMATMTATETPHPSETPDPTNTPFPTPTVSQTPLPSFTPHPTFTPFPTPTPSPTPVPISVGLTQMTLSGRVYCNVAYFGADNIQNLGCNLNDLDSEYAYKCGYKCWSYGDANFTYTFKGVKFELFGTLDPFHKQFDLIIDNHEPIIVDEYNEARSEYVLIYSSDLLDYREHTIKINGRGVDQIYELYKLVFWPKLEARRMNSTELVKTRMWTSESDGIGGVREYTNEAGSTASTTILCTKFWIYSSTCYWHQDMILNFNGKNHTISLYSEDRRDAAIVFESEELTFGNYDLKITSTGTIMLYCIYYMNDPPPPTQTPYPSRTFYPENSQTYIDKVFLNYVLSDRIEVTKTNQIDQISGCTFTDMMERSDILINIEKEIPFFDNIFETFDSNLIPPSVIYSQFNGHLFISNCTFRNQRSRTKNGNVFTSQDDTTIDVTFDLCKFINCGKTTSDIIIKINGKDSALNMTNCVVSFDNETISGMPIWTLSTDVIIDSCQFYKSGTIRIDSQISNGTFQYTNNNVSSISQQFIFAQKLTKSLIFADNIFKDVQVSNVSFIYINHELDEIEIKNTTFENITSELYDVYGGAIGLMIVNADYSQTTLYFDQCNFYDNVNNHSEESIFAHGGAFQCGYLSTMMKTSLQFTNCQFLRNNCVNGKGGALSISVTNEVTISNCTFEDNSAKQEGGAIFVWGKITQISDSNAPELSDSLQLEKVTISNCQFIGNQASKGACIYAIEDNVKFINFEVYSSNFTDNSCENTQQFLIRISSTNIKFAYNTVTFHEMNVKNPSLMLNFSESAEITYSTFVNSQTQGEQIIRIEGIGEMFKTTVTNCTFINCVSKKFVIIIPSGITVVENCSFRFSLSRNACSGLEIISPISVDIINCEFQNNNNKVINSGTLYIHSESDKTVENVNINGLLFNSCIGTSYRTLSVAIADLSSDVFNVENVFIENISTGSSMFGINVNKKVNFYHCRFRNNNFGNNYGGGYGSYMIPSQHITFDNCEWTNNYCSDNGGAFGGVIFNNDDSDELLLKLKSLTFNECKFVLNSCLGNGGALYVDMTAESSITRISSCLFEANKAFGDCGAIFARNKNDFIVEKCHFLNNTAIKSMLSNAQTDSLFINGNCYALISETNFTKGSFRNEQTNYQFTHFNDDNDAKSDFNVTITHCMFSVINPSNQQLFAREVDTVGKIYISFSTFTHFVTNEGETNGLFLNVNNEVEEFATLDNFNHLFESLNDNVFINDCCFDNDEEIVKNNINNNVLNSQCSYPTIVDEIIAQINNYEINKPSQTPVAVVGSSATMNPFAPNEVSRKTNKTKIIIGAAIGSFCFAMIVVVIVLVVVIKKIKKKAKKSSQKKKNVDFDEEQENELEQETIDSLNMKYDKKFSFFATQMITQENPLYTRAKQTKMEPSVSSDEDTSFEESHWGNEYI